jgi:Cys-rich protein (TIGR01571 family)
MDVIYTTTSTTTTVEKSPNGEFQVGLFDIFGDFGTFCMASVCPCVIYGQTQQQLLGKPDYTADCCLFCVFQTIGCPCFLGMSGRTAIRTVRGIRGNGCFDCVLHCCFRPCALTQEKREVQQFRYITTVITSQPIGKVGPMVASEPPIPQPIAGPSAFDPPPQYSSIYAPSAPVMPQTPKKHE